MNELMVENPFFFFPVAIVISISAVCVLCLKSNKRALFCLGLTIFSINVVFLAQRAIILSMAHGIFLFFAFFIILLKHNNLDKLKGLRQKEKKGSTFVKLMQVGSLGAILGVLMGSLSFQTYENLYKSGEPFDILLISLLDQNIYMVGLISFLIVIILVGVFMLRSSKGETL